MTLLIPAINDNGQSPSQREWVAGAVAFLSEERERSKATPLIRLAHPPFAGVDIYIKDESCHPSGSLKHRLAHALYLHAICNGDIGPGSLVVEASSGSTAISEAWFARALGLPYIAVVPASTAPAKLRLITELGAEIHAAAPGEDLSAVARALAQARSGHFMDQFGKAAEVTDWRGSNNIAESLFSQMAGEPHPIPAYVVVGAGTGGTSATIGRYIRLRPDLSAVQLCVVDPQGSAFFASYASCGKVVRGCSSALVEGIGRPCVEPSFNAGLVDHMLSIPDIASIAGAWWLREQEGLSFGPSTGTNLVGAMLLAHAMHRRGQSGSIVTLGCDEGQRYLDTIYDENWLAEHRIDLDDWLALPRKLAAFAFPGPIPL